MLNFIIAHFNYFIAQLNITHLFLLNSYGFFEFQNEQMALEAVKQTDGYRLDKNHTFSVTLMSDFDRYEKIFNIKTRMDNNLF